jgi:hypothetical protein
MDENRCGIIQCDHFITKATKATRGFDLGDDTRLCVLVCACALVGILNAEPSSTRACVRLEKRFDPAPESLATGQVWIALNSGRFHHTSGSHFDRLKITTHV